MTIDTLLLRRCLLGTLAAVKERLEGSRGESSYTEGIEDALLVLEKVHARVISTNANDTLLLFTHCCLLHFSHQQMRSAQLLMVHFACVYVL